MQRPGVGEMLFPDPFVDVYEARKLYQLLLHDTAGQRAKQQIWLVFNYLYYYNYRVIQVNVNNDVTLRTF